MATDSRQSEADCSRFRRRNLGYQQCEWRLRFNPGTERFEQVPNASLVQIAVGADGDVWGLGKTGQSYRFNRLTQQFDQIPGTLSQISVGTGSNVWGLGTAGQLYEYNTQSASWTLIASAPLTQISVGADGSVWGIDSSDNAYQFIGPTQPVQMFQQAPGKLAHIAAGTDGSVWGVNSLVPKNPLRGIRTELPNQLRPSGARCIVVVIFAQIFIPACQRKYPTACRK